MQLMTRLRLLIFLLSIVSLGTWLTGCSSTKNIPEGDALYTGSEVKVEATGDIPDEDVLKDEMEGAIQPKPNASFLGLRPKLWIHNAVGPTDKKKGFKHFMAYKVGAAPVLLTQVDTGRINGVIRNKLHNRGYFDSKVSSSTKIEKRKASITFTSKVKPPYRIRKIELPAGDSIPLFGVLRELQKTSLLKAGDPYNLDVMIAERVRIDQELKNRGYYFFSPDFLLYKVDSTVGKRQVDVLVRVKPETPPHGLQAYVMDDVYVNTNYSLGDTTSVQDTLKMETFYYIPNENYIRSKYLMQAVFLEKDKTWSAIDHRLTISRLMGLGTFKYATVKYDRDTLSPGKLDAQIFLTTNLKKSLRVEPQYVTKTNNFAGPGMTTSFRNRNAFKGSELLSVNLITNFESQVSGVGSALNSYELGIRADLTFPRFVAPFKVANLRTEYSPKTRINAGYSLLNRVQYFQMNSIYANYNYSWRPRKPVTWEITPINLLFVELASTTDTFEVLLEKNTFLRRSFEQQYILGSIFQFTFNTQVYPERRDNFVYNVNLDLSGNLANAFRTVSGDPKPTDEDPRTIAGKPFSQYARLENEFKYYHKLTKKTLLATRFIGGVGLPYGNSSTLPYVKQFTIGGSNSIRAFRARSIGPGVYDLPDELATSYFDQTGDIKLETNVEYRFPISGFLRGALFVDAGNIWLIEESPDRPGGEFTPGKIFQQLALGTGFGLRIDVEYFVLRFDLGVPLRRPGESVTPSVSLSGKDGAVLNIAIGYPF
jgi:outer membrane protein assembly factor BamA